MDRKYTVKFDFTDGRQEHLLEMVWPTEIGKRIIRAELGLEPDVDNGDGDVRYGTDDPAVFVELLKLCVQHSAGGWWTAEPMPNGEVFNLPMRGGKYSNCPDYKARA